MKTLILQIIMFENVSFQNLSGHHSLIVKKLYLSDNLSAVFVSVISVFKIDLTN